MSTNRSFADSYHLSFLRAPIYERHYTHLQTTQAIMRHRKDGGPLKCKRCVQAVEEAERKAATEKRVASAIAGSSDDPTEIRKCTICKEGLAYSAYNKNQWNKGEGKSKCRSCVEKALAREASEQKASKDEKLEAARSSLKLAEASGNTPAILKAGSIVAALEAEKVTGLKPIRMGRGGGRGRGRTSGRLSGRGRGKTGRS